LNILVDFFEILFRIWQVALPIIDPDESNTGVSAVFLPTSSWCFKINDAMKYFTHKPNSRRGFIH
jgi:hypothetical protein